MNSIPVYLRSNVCRPDAGSSNGTGVHIGWFYIVKPIVVAWQPVQRRRQEIAEGKDFTVYTVTHKFGSIG
jgi:hypothetical protein